MNLGYKIIRWIFNVILNIFYRDIIIEGSIPENCPVIIAGDHRNAAIDGAILTAKVNRQVRFMAKATLFKGFTGWLFKIAGAIPVRRKQDQVDGAKVDNTAPISEAIKTLQRGECFGIFPEGKSHSEAKFQELKPGIALISIGATTKTLEDNLHPVPEVLIIPTGLNYINGEQFRSKCVIHFGTPIKVISDNTVDDVMARVEAGLQKVTLNAPDKKTSSLAKTALHLYLPKDERKIGTDEYVKIKRNFLRAYTISSEDNAISEIKEDITKYHDELERIGINDYIVKNQSAKLPNKIIQVFRYIIGFIMFLPFFVINWPACLMTKIGLVKLIKRGEKVGKIHDMIATYKIGIALISYLVLHITYFVIGLIVGFPILQLLAIYIYTFPFAYIGIKGYEILRKSKYLFLKHTNTPSKQKMKELKEQRNLLVTKIQSMVELMCELHGDEIDRIVKKTN